MWPDWVSNPGHLPLESDALPTALRVCVCVREREREREREGDAYTVISPVGNSPLMIVIFSWGKNYYMYVEKLPYLSSDKADVYTYLHASENSVMQYEIRQHWRKCF